MKTLRDLLEHQIQDLYSGETQIIEALPTMIEAARDDELTQALKDHLEQTRKHKSRLEALADDLGCSAKGDTCKGMKGILKEGDEVVGEEAEEDDVQDAAIITACQRVEHYEMAGYGSARTYARMLDERDVANALQEILDQEQDADEKLTRIAEGHVNRRAMATN